MINRIKLEHLARLMKSDDGHDRLIAEYIRLKQWYESIKKFNNKVEAGRYFERPVITPDTKIPYELSRELQSNIGQLLHTIEVAAVIEDIDIEWAINSLVEKALWGEAQCCEGTEATRHPSAVPTPSSIGEGGCVEDVAPYKEGEGICCCQKDGVPPCEEGINNPPVELPEGIMRFNDFMEALEVAVECERHAGDKDCEKEKCPLWKGKKCLWGEAELYENAFYYLNKYGNTKGT